MFKRQTIIFTVILVFLSGCQSTSHQEPIVLPSWIQLPPQDNESAFYGIGSSYNIEQAKTVALQDISAKLGISLVGETQINEQMAGSRYVRYIDSNIKTVQGETQLSRYQVMNTYTDKSRVYILIKVFKANVLADNFQQLIQLNNKAIQQNKKWDKESSLKWNINSQQLLEENTAKAMRYAIIINMLDPNQKIGELMRSWASLAKKLSELKLCVNIKNTDILSKQYLPSLESHLVNQNIQLTVNCNTQLSISSTVEKNKLFDYYTFKNTLHFKLKTKEEGGLVSESIVVKGKSMTSIDIAERISVNDLKNKLNNVSLWKIIKL